MVKDTNFEAPQFVIFSFILLLIFYYVQVFSAPVLRTAESVL
jgi:hypothetical protein